MLNTTYFRPKNLNDALAALQEKEYENVVMAGGTDLMVVLRSQGQTLKRVIDISRIRELNDVTVSEAKISIGAGVTFSKAMANDILKKQAPLLVAACSQVGSPQIRNVGTIGGNIVNAAVCADSIPALVCLDAVLHLKKKDSNREMKIDEFVLGRNQTKMESGELLTQITFDMQNPGERWGFIKLGRRNAVAISRLTVAVRGGLDSKGSIQTVHIALGAVTPQIDRWLGVEKFLIGKAPDAALFKKSGEMIAEQMIAKYGRRWSTEYKEIAVARLVERALVQAFLTTIQ